MFSDFKWKFAIIQYDVYPALIQSEPNQKMQMDFVTQQRRQWGNNERVEWNNENLFVRLWISDE